MYKPWNTIANNNKMGQNEQISPSRTMPLCYTKVVEYFYNAQISQVSVFSSTSSESMFCIVADNSTFWLYLAPLLIAEVIFFPLLSSFWRFLKFIVVSIHS